MEFYVILAISIHEKTEEEEVGLHMQFDINNEEHRNRLACETAFYIMNKNYRETKKFVDIPVDFVTEGGFELGRIWNELSEQFQQGELSDSSIRFLLGIKKQFFDSPKKTLKSGWTGHRRHRGITKSMKPCQCRTRRGSAMG